MLNLEDLPRYKASDGRDIVLIPGWFENKIISGWPLGIKDLKTFVETCIEGKSTGADYPISPAFFVNKLITADTMREVLGEIGYRFDGTARLLDLCTGPAVLPRAFKALGLCREAHGVDLQDRQNEYTDETFLAIWRANRDATGQGGAESGKQIFDFYEKLNNMQTGINNCFNLLFAVDKANENCSMDSYIVSDFLSYEPSGKFDLVTMVSGADYFDMDEFFAKVSDLMEVGGVFATFNEYTYEVFACAMHLPMDAPWLHSRLTKDDLYRYYDEMRPEIAEAARKAIYFPSIHLTVRDYADAASKSGLELICHRRKISSPSVRDMLFTDSFLREYFYNFVVPDARVVNPYVVPEDFFTSWLTLVFRKVA